MMYAAQQQCCRGICQLTLQSQEHIAKCKQLKKNITRASVPDEQPLGRERSVVIIKISGRQHSELCGVGCRDMRCIHNAPNDQFWLP